MVHEGQYAAGGRLCPRGLMQVLPLPEKTNRHLAYEMTIKNTGTNENEVFIRTNENIVWLVPMEMKFLVGSMRMKDSMGPIR